MFIKTETLTDQDMFKKKKKVADDANIIPHHPNFTWTGLLHKAVYTLSSYAT